MTSLEALTRVGELLLAPTAAALEEALALLERLSGRTEGLDSAEGRRLLAVCRTLAQQSEDYYGRLHALLEARLASYTAGGLLRLPEQHQFAVDG